MDDEDDQAVPRKALHTTIQASAHGDDSQLDGAVLMGWVCVAEWMGPDDRRWLSTLGADARGESCPEWQAQGYLHNRLFDSWNEGDES